MPYYAFEVDENGLIQDLAEVINAIGATDINNPDKYWIYIDPENSVAKLKTPDSAEITMLGSDFVKQLDEARQSGNINDLASLKAKFGQVIDSMNQEAERLTEESEDPAQPNSYYRVTFGPEDGKITKMEKVTREAYEGNQRESGNQLMMRFDDASKSWDFIDGGSVFQADKASDSVQIEGKTLFDVLGAQHQERTNNLLANADKIYFRLKFDKFGNIQDSSPATAQDYAQNKRNDGEILVRSSGLGKQQQWLFKGNDRTYSFIAQKHPREFKNIREFTGNQADEFLPPLEYARLELDSEGKVLDARSIARDTYEGNKSTPSEIFAVRDPETDLWQYVDGNKRTVVTDLKGDVNSLVGQSSYEAKDDSLPSYASASGAPRTRVDSLPNYERVSGMPKLQGGDPSLQGVDSGIKYENLPYAVKMGFEELEGRLASKKSGTYLNNVLQGKSIKDAFNTPYKAPDDKILEEYIRPHFVVKDRRKGFRRVELDDLTNPALQFVNPRSPQQIKTCYDVQDSLPFEASHACKTMNAAKRINLQKSPVAPRMPLDIGLAIDDNVRNRSEVQKGAVENMKEKAEKASKGRTGTALERFFKIPHGMKSEVVKERLLADKGYLKALNEGDTKKCKSMERRAGIKNFFKKAATGVVNVLTLNVAPVKAIAPLDKWLDKHPYVRTGLEVAGTVAKSAAVLGVIAGVTVATGGIGAVAMAPLAAAGVGPIASAVIVGAGSAAITASYVGGSRLYGKILEEKDSRKDDVANITKGCEADAASINGFTATPERIVCINFNGWCGLGAENMYVSPSIAAKLNLKSDEPDVLKKLHVLNDDEFKSFCASAIVQITDTLNKGGASADASKKIIGECVKNLSAERECSAYMAKNQQQFEEASAAR